MAIIAPYAVTEQNSRGRQFPEKPHPYRTDFERDRDRVIHSAAFRRLEGKTQVFTTGQNDQYRTRMTHSIEVAQIGRTIARVLNLNESLTEAICLAHDLGHSPFGHNGQDILNELMADAGGFEHNRQSLRIVDLIEHPYPDFPGLNLMYETRKALAKHQTTYDHPEDIQAPSVSAGIKAHDVNDGTISICLEGQIADISDRIAYNCHDLEDGLRSRLLDEKQLEGIALYQQACLAIHADRIDDIVIRRTRISKAILDYLAGSVIETGKAKLHEYKIQNLQQVYACTARLIELSDTAETQLCQLEQFLFKNLYNHPKIIGQLPQIKLWLTGLFEKFTRNPDLMPHYYQNMIVAESLKRVVCDYISGMTDRYAITLLE
jgi:dGTPase